MFFCLDSSRVSLTLFSFVFNPFSTAHQSYIFKHSFNHIATLAKNEWIASAFKIKCTNLSIEYRVPLDCPQTLLPGSPRLSFPTKRLFPRHSRLLLWLFMPIFHLCPILFSLSSKTLLFIHTSKSSSFGKPSLASPELVPPPGIPSAIVLIREWLVTWVCLFVITFVYLSSPPPSPPTMLWDPWAQSQVLVHLYPWSIALVPSHSRVWKTLNE